MAEWKAALSGPSLSHPLLIQSPSYWKRYSVAQPCDRPLCGLDCTMTSLPPAALFQSYLTWATVALFDLRLSLTSWRLPDSLAMSDSNLSTDRRESKRYAKYGRDFGYRCFCCDLGGSFSQAREEFLGALFCVPWIADYCQRCSSSAARFMLYMSRSSRTTRII